MSFEIPKTRSEKILQNILGAKNEIEPIQSRIEAILYAILNETEIGEPYTAPARCEIEKLLVAIKDGGEYNETPLTRSGRILLCKLRGEDYTGITQSRLEKLFLRWLYELMEITDVPPFTFKSKGNNLIDYDIYGAEDGVGDNEDKTVSGNPISVSDAVEAPAESLKVTFTPTQSGTPWIDSEPETSPYLSKVIPRGNKEYYSLVGGTVAWNQLVHGDFGSDYATYWNVYSGTGSVNDGVLTVTDAVGRSGIKAKTGYGLPSSVAGHYLLFSVDYKSTVDLQGYAGATFDFPASSNFVRSIKIKKAVANPSAARLSLDFFPNRAGEIGTFSFANFQIIDLTQIFGSTIADYAYSLEQSEEGSGVEWLKSYGFLTKDYYPYNPGELISVKTSGHKVGSTTYPLSDTELRGLFKLDVNNKLYCEGDLYPPSGSVTRKYGIVDLGTLSWGSSNDAFYAAGGVNTAIALAKEYTISVIANAVCTSYICNKRPYLASGQFSLHKSDVNYLTIIDSNYSDVTAFKTAMSGVYLVYELATPTTESLTPYTSPVDVEAGGTEEFIDDRTVPVPVGNETYYAAEYAVEGKTGVTVNHSATSSDTPTEYEVQFTSQGTVYGGTVDIVSGVLSVNYGYVDLGSLVWRRYKFGEVYCFFVNVPDRVPSPNGQKCYCSKYNKVTAIIGVAYLSNKGMAINTNQTYIYIRDDSYTDENSFKASLNGTTLVYELATPQTYTLTPEQVTMLLGSNYLETEDGTITLTYKDSNIVLPFSVSCGADVNSYEVPLTDKLYKVSAYADSVSYDDQTVKREIIVEKLDGSEEWILSDGVFSTTLTTRARTTAVLCNELTTEQCYISDDLTTLNVTGVPQTSVEEFVTWLQAGDVCVQYVREQTLVVSHQIPEVSTFNGTNTFSVDTEVTPSEVTIIYPNKVTTRTLPKTKKVGTSKLMKSK